MRTNENGRSMIEMLGVLAIIGVLSVGGIYGYTVAMRKYKANEIIQTASMLATMAQSGNAGEGKTMLLSKSGLEQSPGGTAVSMCAHRPTGTPPVSQVDINIKTDADGKLCAQILSIVPKTETLGKDAGYYVDAAKCTHNAADITLAACS